MTPLRHVRLVDALDAMVAMADRPLRYEFQDYAVVFSSPPPETLELHTKTFQVSTNTFLDGVQAVTGVALPAESDPKRRAAIQTVVRDFLRACGVKLPAPGPSFPTNPVEDQRAVFFNDLTGVLSVRGTLSDLDIVEKAVEAVGPGFGGG